jgi:hypothetical protein
VQTTLTVVVPLPLPLPFQPIGVEVPFWTTGSFALMVLFELSLLTPPPIAILPAGQFTVTVMPSAALPLTTVA